MEMMIILVSGGGLLFGEGLLFAGQILPESEIYTIKSTDFPANDHLISGYLPDMNHSRPFVCL